MRKSIKISDIGKYLEQPYSSLHLHIQTANTKGVTEKYKDEYRTSITGSIYGVENGCKDKKELAVLAEVKFGASYQITSFMTGFLYLVQSMNTEGIVPVFYNSAQIANAVAIIEQMPTEYVQGGTLCKMGRVRWCLPEYPYLYCRTPFLKKIPACLGYTDRKTATSGYDLKYFDKIEQSFQKGVIQETPWKDVATWGYNVVALLRYAGYQVYVNYIPDVHVYVNYIPDVHASFNFKYIIKKDVEQV